MPICNEHKKNSTNFFWGHHVEYLINGGKHEIPGNPIDQAFHKYTIDW
jgi:hypothetical protein